MVFRYSFVNYTYCGAVGAIGSGMVKPPMLGAVMPAGGGIYIREGGGCIMLGTPIGGGIFNPMGGIICCP